MNAADVFVQKLQALGVPCIYALCGNGLDPLLDATDRWNMRVIDTRNEQAAAYMADAAGRMTRRIGVVAVSSGVAHMNALTGVCNAWYDGSPMLLITGASDSTYRGRGVFQDMETAALAEPLCKYSARVETSAGLAAALDEAVEAAVSGRPGPVHLTVPADVFAGEVADPAPAASDRGMVTATGGADGSRVAGAAGILAKARRPVIVAGSGVFYADGSESLSQLASTLQAPVVVPIWDRGAVESPIPEFCGVVGAASGEPRILPEADAIVLMGARVDYRIGYLEAPAIASDAAILRIDIDPAELEQGVKPDVSLPGDPRTVAGQLVAELGKLSHSADGSWLAEARKRSAAFRDATVGAPPSVSSPATGHHVVDGMMSAVGDDTIVLVDGGNIGQWFHMAACDRYPERWVTCGRSAVVGWGFPAAAAARSLNPDKDVLLLSGDGSSTFTLSEIETAVRQNLPYVAIIADDSAWGIVVSGCKQRGVTPVAAELSSIRFDLVAQGYGARGIRVDDVSKLPALIAEGFASKQVTVLHVPIKTGGPAD